MGMRLIGKKAWLSLRESCRRRRLKVWSHRQAKVMQLPTMLQLVKKWYSFPAHFSGVSVKKILAASGIRFLLR